MESGKLKIEPKRCADRQKGTEEHSQDWLYHENPGAGHINDDALGSILDGNGFKGDAALSGGAGW